MNRREFIKINVRMALAGIALAGTQGLPTMLGVSTSHAASSVNLTIQPVLWEMVDGIQVNAWAFDDGSGPRIPGVIVNALEGEQVTFNITNNNSIPHGFGLWNGTQILPGTTIASIQPGGTGSVTFTAPAAGSYMYVDPLNWPLHRVMGLNGALFVKPQNAVLPNGNRIPYSSPPAAMQELFSDFGKVSYFPGDDWDPARTWLWMFHSVDPNWNQTIQTLACDGNAAGIAASVASFTTTYTPQYFLINGRSGHWSGHEPDTAPYGNVGMPALIVSMNSGLNAASPHIHGNHVFELAANGTVKDNLIFLDTWSMLSGDIKSHLLPFIIPPDTINSPEDPAAWSAAGGVPKVEVASGVLRSQFPFVYPMHCHLETSQTAAGGNYPNGSMTHWSILSPTIGGPVDPALIGKHPDRRIFGDPDPRGFTNSVGL
ncbi:multicopper oxidase domain-containing protein [Fundidesulfovibrio soli]|uniref:multicopper oxidase domain-containing protein n=1 Tax=Fundidesulfovibrio soli TaxID=2922716 RepID=UPI001FAFE898|nr:multicopper oxidase domain-containing protein [Fundidesulfovibrio soli]